MAEDCLMLQCQYWDNGEVVLEEEALSFSDLPVGLNQKQQRKKNEENCSNDSEPEFEFGPGFRSEMCAADELFFGGRILPLRCRDSPVHSLAKKSMDEAILSPNGSVSRIHVVDSGSISWATTSMSSRSSSQGSQQSSISGMISNSSSFGSPRGTLSYINQISSCSSRCPQEGFSGSNKHFLVPPGNKSPRDSLSLSSLWEFFRLGLVRKPDVELHNLKIRPNNNRNGCNITINDSNSKDASMKTEKKKKTTKKKVTVGFGFLGGCNCMADSVATHLTLKSTWRKKSHVGSVEEEQLRWKLTESTSGGKATSYKHEHNYWA